MTEKLLTARQVAEALAVKEQTVRKWAIDGKHLPVVHIGRSARYRESDIRRLIDQGSK
jgi:excisionase family DNA binding protein